MNRGLLLAGMLLAVTSALAAGDSVVVTHAWVRWLPVDLPAGGYAIIANRGDGAMRLVGADSPDYGMVMLHRSVQRDGVERMQAVDGVDVPAHGSAELAPGGYHFMLMHPLHAIAPGDSVRMRLHFADGSTIDAEFPVRPATAQGG
jgi:copper(I)-binding protein